MNSYMYGSRALDIAFTAFFWMAAAFIAFSCFAMGSIAYVVLTGGCS